MAKGKMNKTCRGAASRAFTAFRDVHGTDTTQTDAIDLITDLLLMLHEQGEDAAQILRIATNHYEHYTGQAAA